MIFYLILIIAFILDYINLCESRNYNDKKIYIASMVLICILGIGFLMYSDKIEIAPTILNLINFYEGDI